MRGAARIILRETVAGRVIALLLTLLASPLLVGCTSILARQGDPDMEVLHRGAQRSSVESEMGRAREVIPLEKGRYMVVYRIKLGAPVNVKRGQSAENLGKGVSASLATGAFNALLNSAVSSGWSSATRSNGAAALAVGLTVWGVSELAGTVRELTRLSKRKKHRLEVVYDDRNRMLSHHVIPLERGGGGDSQAARELANEARSAEPPSDQDLRSRWRVARR